MDATAERELLEPPSRGRVFRAAVRPGIGDCAPSGRVRLDGIARWLQDVAYEDVLDAGRAADAAWVLRNTHVRVRRFPMFAEELTAATFCSGLGSMWAERRTDILAAGEGDPLVQTAAIWVHLDPVSRRPVPFSPAEREYYGVASGQRRVRARLHHPPPSLNVTVAEWTFRAAETDLADHVNNAAYWVPVEEALLVAAREPRQLEATVEFRNPAQPGVKRLLADGEMLWIADPETGELHASAHVRVQR